MTLSAVKAAFAYFLLAFGYFQLSVVFHLHFQRMFHVEHLRAMCAPPCRASQAIQQVFDALRRSRSPCKAIGVLCASFICEALPRFGSAQYLTRMFYVEHLYDHKHAPL